MPRYYFDIIDADSTMVDKTGLEFESLDTATAEARRAILEMAKDTFMDADGGQIKICVRDGHEGPVVITVSMASVAADNL